MRQQELVEYFISLDEQRLQQILLNLISNAIKFTPCGGEINVKAKIVKDVKDLSVQDQALEMAVITNPNKTFLEMQIQDNGIGISKDDIQKLFQLFGFLNSTKQINTKGIGLGLHITKKITKMFDGDIICQSQKGHGATFIFILAMGLEDSNSKNVSEASNRIQNPVKKQYEKIELPNR